MNDAPIYMFHRIGGGPAPAYRIEANGVDIGYCKAATASPYPGRGRAAYEAHSIFNSTPIGVYDSRADAAEAIMNQLHRTARGRLLRDKVRRAA